MKHVTIKLSLLFLATMSLAGVAFAANEKSLPPNVDVTTGAISVPEDYYLWPTLAETGHNSVSVTSPFPQTSESLAAFVWSRL